MSLGAQLTPSNYALFFAILCWAIAALILFVGVVQLAGGVPYFIYIFENMLIGVAILFVVGLGLW